MGLLQIAAQTYDYMVDLVGVPVDEKQTLAPVGFVSKKAQIEIVLNVRGEFVTANSIDAKIIFPATQGSAGRTSKAAVQMPHPLCDKVFYMLPENTVSYRAYLDVLREWCDSAFANEKVKAIYTYVQAGKIRENLGNLIGEKAEEFVCWRVVSDNPNDNEKDAVWENKAVMDSFTKFYLDKLSAGEAGLCYVTGQNVPLAEQHLKGVISSSANAKIISANDSVNFTYRGRFLDDKEALSVGYETSQKAHNVLKWLVENDGVYFGGKTMICWNPRGKKLPKPQYSLFRREESDSEKITPTAYRERLAKIIDGYRAEFAPDDNTVIAVFQAATSGRLSVTYYNEMRAGDFLERLRFWDETCVWNSGFFGVGSPSLKAIIDASYGVQRGNDELSKIEVDDAIKAQQMQRLLLCRLDKFPFPMDVMRSAVQKCGMICNYNKNNAEQQLFTTCAIIKKYRYDHFKEEWDMALETERKDRSYQYGRLLAVMEKIEKDSFDKDTSRETNATRMQAVFVKRPAYATKIVMEQLKNSAYPRIPVGSRNYYDKLIGEIMEMLSQDDPASFNKPLSETYLLGYYLQKNALYTKKTENNVEEN